jgi:hypothetical protein
VEKSGPKIRPSYFFFQKTAQCKQSSKRRKFTQSGHPALYLHDATHKVTEKTEMSHLRKMQKIHFQIRNFKHRYTGAIVFATTACRTTGKSLFRSSSVMCMWPGWPDEFLKNSPKNVAQTIFCLIQCITFTAEKVAQ